jgi:predicted DNA-binding ribbon-helix-helix protein
LKKIPFSTQLDKDLYDWLHEEAKRRHCSIAQIIRDLIVEKIQKSNENK